MASSWETTFVLTLALLPGMAVEVKTFLGLFVRMPLLKLSGPPARVYTNCTVEACARYCTQETHFDCQSFDVDNSLRKCMLYNISHEKGVLQVAHITDHYRSAFEKLFNRLPNHVVTLRHNRKVSRVSVEECSRRCVFEVGFKCEGFDYEPELRSCWLTEDTPETAGGVRSHKGADYYRRSPEGPLSKFVCYGSGSLPSLEGHQIYNRVMLGVTLDACAQLCTSEQTFECCSFDYYFEEKACHMSQYIAANVNGVTRDHIDHNAVMHYEKKAPYLDYFYPTPYAVVLGNNERTFERVTPNRCARSCLEETKFVCRSFDYQIQDATCMLSSKTGSDVGGLYDQGATQVHHFEMKPFLDCGGVMTTATGNFASPNWPRKYAHHLNCSWHVNVPQHKVVKFTFTHLVLGRKTHNPCDEVNDKLMVMEMTSHGPVRFCADQNIGSYVSQSNNITIQLVTNGQHDAQGFRVFYETDWPCHALLTTDFGEFASPGWPQQYAADQTCVWTITAPPDARVFLHFTNVDFPKYGLGRCNEHYDSVEVYDGESPAAARLSILCGSEAPSSITSRYNTLLVKFHSDSSKERTGFHATYKFLYKVTSSPSIVPTTAVRLGVKVHQEHPELNDSSLQSALTADFLEPTYDFSNSEHSLTSATNMTTTRDVQGRQGEDGGVLVGVMDAESPAEDNQYLYIMWTLVTSLFVMLIIVIVVLVVVCRYYKRRLPKRRNVPNYAFTEVNLSLYEKDNMLNAQCEDSETQESPACASEFNSEEVSFYNPLYERRFPKTVDSEDGSPC
ncbi:uncharacterized protein LOC124120195 [Haliotis rufescens]|uniref:uncharacterized protein LOC124120195 n=1 Tax=Haliotis rufescens TaxID=6454 RepID=UPI00201EB43C|nr:uncharacterized protein LOC124120195 [Haliotis rufescens]